MHTQHTPSGAILGRLAAHLGTVPGEAVRVFCSRFRLQLSHFAEYGVHLQERRVSVMTLGCGAAFGSEVGRFLASMGFGAHAAEEVHALQRAIDAWMLVRVSVAQDGAPEVGIYFRKAVPVADALVLLGRFGIDGAASEAVFTLAGLVQTDRTGILAAQLRPASPAWFRVYLHAYHEPGRPLGATLTRVFERFDVPRGRWADFVGHLGVLQEGGVSDVFVSLGLGLDAPPAPVKLDFFRVPLGPLESSLRAAGCQPEESAAVARIGAELGLDSVEHFGLAFGPTGVAVTAYFAPGPRWGRR